MALPTQDIAEGRIGFRETLVRFSLFFVLPLPKSQHKPNTTVAAFLLFVFDILPDPLAAGEFLCAFGPRFASL